MFYITFFSFKLFFLYCYQYPFTRKKRSKKLFFIATRHESTKLPSWSENIEWANERGKSSQHENSSAVRRKLSNIIPKSSHNSRAGKWGRKFSFVFIHKFLFSQERENNFRHEQEKEPAHVCRKYFLTIDAMQSCPIFAWGLNFHIRFFAASCGG